MADRLKNLRIVDPVLTNLIQGFSTAEFVADQLFPIVDVDEEGGSIPQLTREHFRQYNMERGVHGDTNLAYMKFVDAPIDFKLKEYDLGIPIDYREEEAAAKLFSLQSHAKDLLGEMFLRRREIEVAALVQTTGNYTNGNTSTPTTKWNAANSTPIKDIRAAIENRRMIIGRKPNVALIPADVWLVLMDHPDVIGRLTQNSTQIVTEEIFASLIGVQKVVIGAASWETDAGVMTPIWSDGVVLAHVTPGVRAQRNPMMPSFGYVLSLRKFPQVDTYMREGNKVQVVRGTYREKALFHGNIAGYFLSNVLA